MTRNVNSPKNLKKSPIKHVAKPPCRRSYGTSGVPSAQPSEEWGWMGRRHTTSGGGTTTRNNTPSLWHSEMDSEMGEEWTHRVIRSSCGTPQDAKHPAERSEPESGGPCEASPEGVHVASTSSEERGVVRLTRRAKPDQEAKPPVVSRSLADRHSADQEGPSVAGRIPIAKQSCGA